MCPASVYFVQLLLALLLVGNSPALSTSIALASPEPDEIDPQPPVDRIHMLVVSDTHIGGPWFADQSIFALYRFLQPLTHPQTTVHTLVLKGDFLDNWNLNYTDRVLSFPELLRSENFHGVNVSAFTDSLRRIRKNGVRIVAIPGNHDMEIRKSDFEVVGIDVEFIQNGIWIENNYRLEHGNRYDLFNAPDPAETIKPFGYIVTRSSAESNISLPDISPSVSKIGLENQAAYPFLVSAEELQPWGSSYESSLEFVYWLCDHILAPIVPLGVELFRNCSMLYERIIGGALGERVEVLWNPLYEKYKFREVENGCEYMYNTGGIQLYREVQKYRTLFARWLKGHDKKFMEYMIQSTCFDVKHWAEQVSQDLLVMSHTHRPRLDVFERSIYQGGHIVSANTGSWVSKQDWFSFVRMTTIVENDKIGNCTEVELVEWTAEGKEVVRAKSPVPYDAAHQFDLNRDHVGIWTGWRGSGEKGKAVNSWNCGVYKDDPPPGWTCDPDFFGSNDGCDCDCGVPDPDCKCASGHDCEVILASNVCCKN